MSLRAVWLDRGRYSAGRLIASCRASEIDGINKSVGAAYPGDPLRRVDDSGLNRDRCKIRVEPWLCRRFTLK